MSGAVAEETVKSAVPIADLGALDVALTLGGDALKEAIRKTRPADVGRDLSRRSVEEGRALVQASDDRRAAAILRSAHPAVAANVLTTCDPAHSARLLSFMPT